MLLDATTRRADTGSIVKRSLATGICAVLALALLAPATASAAKAEAKVTISHFTLPENGSWNGVIKSDRKACVKNREVTVYRREGKENDEIGSDTAAKDGNRWLWSVGTGNLKMQEGKYFALAPPTAKCKRAESKIFDYPEDNPTRGAPTLERRSRRRR